jgi:hypothetical protein
VGDSGNLARDSGKAKEAGRANCSREAEEVSEKT